MPPEPGSVIERALTLQALGARPALDLPVGFGPEWERLLVREGEAALALGDGERPCCVLARVLDDAPGGIEVDGPDLDCGAVRFDLGVRIDIAGAALEADFEAFVERRAHTWLNRLEGVTHTGRRDNCRVRVRREAVSRGLRLIHFARVLEAMLTCEFGGVVEAFRIRLTTRPDAVRRLIETEARPAYARRDARSEGLKDDDAKAFYTCAVCQSVVPNHCCVLTPQRPGMCGALDWPDAAVACRLNPAGPCAPIPLSGPVGACVDAAVRRATRGAVRHVTPHALMDHPATTSPFCECVCALEPMSGGVAIIGQSYRGMTPVGMDYDALIHEIAGVQTPGFMGVSAEYLLSEKFLAGEGGPLRIVWMDSAVKRAVAGRLDRAVRARYGVAGFSRQVADEDDCTEPGTLMDWLRRHRHPVLGMENPVRD